MLLWSAESPGALPESGFPFQLPTAPPPRQPGTRTMVSGVLDSHVPGQNVSLWDLHPLSSRFPVPKLSQVTRVGSGQRPKPEAMPALLPSPSPAAHLPASLAPELSPAQPFSQI